MTRSSDAASLREAMHRVVVNELPGVSSWQVGLANRLTDAALSALAAAREPVAPAEAEPPGLRAAFAFLRKRLVGTPPDVDMMDAWMADLLEEAESVGRAADREARR